MDKIIAQFMGQVLHCVMRGLISCFPHERPEKILILASAMMAQQVTLLYAGDELSVYKLRKACRDAFETTMKEAAVIPHVPPETSTTVSIDAAMKKM